ncbi:hypothetical protein D3C75_1121860 [compost metagenome]
MGPLYCCQRAMGTCSTNQEMPSAITRKRPCRFTNMKGSSPRAIPSGMEAEATITRPTDISASASTTSCLS